MPRICVARIELRDEGNPEAALETLDEAFEFIDEERDLVEAILAPDRGADRARRARRTRASALASSRAP